MLRTPVIAILLLALALVPSVAAADDGASSSEEASWCDEGTWYEGGSRAWFRSDAAIDLYNAGLWGVGVATVHWGTSTPSDSRWSEKNSFDDNIRDGLKFGSSSDRSRARTTSDALLFTSVLAPLAAGLGGTWRDCREMADVTTDWAESMMLTAFLVEGAKAVVARKRPCRGPGCEDEDNRKSFFSGHAAMSAAGAGLLCSQSIRRGIWGEGTAAEAVPCGLGVAASLATGLMRIAGDKHWGTDVLMGWGIGALVGWFDVPGPFDLLRFQIRGDHGDTAAEGIVLPYAGPGGVGARLSVRF